MRFFKRFQKVPKPPTLEDMVKLHIITIEEMLWIKKERAIKDWECVFVSKKKH